MRVVRLLSLSKRLRHHFSVPVGSGKSPLEDVRREVEVLLLGFLSSPHQLQEGDGPVRSRLTFDLSNVPHGRPSNGMIKLKSQTLETIEISEIILINLTLNQGILIKN